MAGQTNTFSNCCTASKLADPTSAPLIAASLRKIIATTTAMERFWRKAHGGHHKRWMHAAAARLDRQVSFAHTLPSYLEPFPAQEAEARLILGYVTLRSLCEGILKLFFAVWLKDYQRDSDAVKGKKGVKPPPDIDFERLITLYSKKGELKYDKYLRRIQQRGNGIHHFADRDIGTQNELIEDIVQFRDFLLAVNDRLPYPDEHYDPGMA